MSARRTAPVPRACADGPGELSMSPYRPTLDQPARDNWSYFCLKSPSNDKNSPKSAKTTRKRPKTFGVRLLKPEFDHFRCGIPNRSLSARRTESRISRSAGQSGIPGFGIPQPRCPACSDAAVVRCSRFRRPICTKTTRFSFHRYR